MRVMNSSSAARLVQLCAGIALIILAPLASPLPGPGGTLLFALGLGLVLRNSLWAKRRYVNFKRKRPKMGNWADWGLRRQSAKRRSQKAKQTSREGN